MKKAYNTESIILYKAHGVAPGYDVTTYFDTYEKAVSAVYGCEAGGISLVRITAKYINDYFDDCTFDYITYGDGGEEELLETYLGEIACSGCVISRRPRDYQHHLYRILEDGSLSEIYRGPYASCVDKVTDMFFQELQERADA